MRGASWIMIVAVLAAALREERRRKAAGRADWSIPFRPDHGQDILDDLGNQGEWPSHPELLDWLARDLMNHGWDHKRAIKQMVLSATYAQDSKVSPELRERDPANMLHARGPARDA